MANRFGLDLTDPRVAAEWERLAEPLAVERRQLRYVPREGAVLWISRPRSYAWWSVARKNLSIRDAIKWYESERRIDVSDDAEDSMGAGVRQKTIAGVLQVMGPETDPVAGRAFLESALSEPSVEGQAEFKRDVCYELLMILDYFERPARFFNEDLPSVFKELLGPKVYLDTDRFDSDDDARFRAAVRLGIAVEVLGPGALLNKGAAEAFRALSIYPEEFGMLVALASGIRTSGSGRLKGSKDPATSPTQVAKRRKLCLYYAIKTYLSEKASEGDRETARKILDRERLLEATREFGCGMLTEDEAHREARNLTVRHLKGLTAAHLTRLVMTSVPIKVGSCS